MTKPQNQETTKRHPRTLLLGVYAPGNQIYDSEGYFEEFLSLIKTADIVYDETFFIKVREISSSHFLTKGKLKDVVDFCEKHDIEEVVCSEILSPVQSRNLAYALECQLFDRAQLILEIFRRAAHTAEAKIQVDIAEFEYLNTRIAGRGKELAQQEGRIGSRGPGETQKELLKRFYQTEIRKLKKRLKTLEKSRDVQRKKRLASNIPLVALIGYTNSGKSSLLNILTHEHVLAEDKLFATLDITTREMYVGDNKKILLSDTVGFISQLPHLLIEAFKSTLDELRYADLLLHVVDISNPLWENHIEIAQDLLEELEIDKPVLYVFNKKDMIDPPDLEDITIETAPYSPSVLTSALDKEGVEGLLDYISRSTTLNRVIPKK